jgi:4-diphosphocytidyl-2-C-methyl-D-erythritol kinase
MVTRDGSLTEFAPAKVNLTLRVLGQLGDGYHAIESLVVFARIGDRVVLSPSDTLALTLRGPNAGAVGPPDDNLIIKAARALSAREPGLRLGRFVLEKRLPVAAGIGGGSADAAAALRLLARANGLTADDGRVFQAARATGADVPVCLDPRPRMMRGIGDILSGPLELPSLPAVLVNPGVALATKDVFRKLGLSPGQTVRYADQTPIPRKRAELFRFLMDGPNDLESAAIALQPAIAKVLETLEALPDVRFARMSGSGSTCFALFLSQRAAAAAARHLGATHPDWWVRATTLS